MPELVEPPPAQDPTALHRPRDVLRAHLPFLVASAIGGALVVLLTWLSSEVYEDVRDAAGLARLDEPALNLAISLRTPVNVVLVNAFTQLGGTIGMSIITAVIIVIMSVRWRSWTPLIVIGVGAAGSLLMTVAGKDLVGRARPPLADAVPPYEYSASFPSGHTLNSTVIASLVAYLIVLHLTSRLAKAVTIALAVLWFVAMGLSRVFLGHHWLTDVIAGWTLGLAWAAIVIGAHQIVLHLRARRREAIPA
jgi:undecaprenyl-diphosphatase